MSADHSEHVASDLSRAPSRTTLLLGTLWPSFSRTLSALLSTLGLPLAILAALSAAKYFVAADLIAVTGLAAKVLEGQQSILERISEFAAQHGLHLPTALVDAAVFYLSIGSTVLRAERDDLISVDNEGSDRAALLREAIGRGRIDSLVLALPLRFRALFVRAAWPLMAVYRLHTPFVVEGPGPSGDAISSSVPRRELESFARMVTGANGWAGQTVYDFRQIVAWHFFIVAAAGFAGSTALSLVQ